jgi:hypothetical protein
MKRHAALLTCVLVAVGVRLSAVQSSPPTLLVVSDSSGAPKVASQPRTPPQNPTAPDLTPNAVLLFPKEVLAVGERRINGLGFKAWPEGKGFRVLVVTVETRDGRDPWKRALKIEDYQPTQLLSVLMMEGESRKISEMATWGLDPWVLKIFPAGTFKPQ